MTDPAPASLWDMDRPCRDCGHALGRHQGMEGCCTAGDCRCPGWSPPAPPPTAPDCPWHGPLSGPPPSAPDAVAEARRLYGEKIDLGHGAVLPRWGAFGRDIVGALLAEVDRLREVIALSRVRELVDRVTAAEAEVRRLRAAGPGPGGGTV